MVWRGRLVVRGAGGDEGLGDTCEDHNLYLFIIDLGAWGGWGDWPPRPLSVRCTHRRVSAGAPARAQRKGRGGAPEAAGGQEHERQRTSHNSTLSLLASSLSCPAAHLQEPAQEREEQQSSRSSRSGSRGRTLGVPRLLTVPAARAGRTQVGRPGAANHLPGPAPTSGDRLEETWLETRAFRWSCARRHSNLLRRLGAVERNPTSPRPDRANRTLRTLVMSSALEGQTARKVQRSIRHLVAHPTSPTRVHAHTLVHRLTLRLALATLGKKGRSPSEEAKALGPTMGLCVVEGTGGGRACRL